MAAVKLSRDYRLTVPRDVRRKLNLRPGDRLEVFVRGATMILVPQLDIKSARGVFGKLSARGVREEDDRRL